VRIFVWLGIWSALYGAQELSHTPAVIAALPHWLQISAPYANNVMAYLMVVLGSLSFWELSLGRLRFLIGAIAVAGLAIAVAAIILFVRTGSSEKLTLYNNLLAVCVLAVLAAVVATPRLSSQYLALPNRGVLAAGTLAFALEALYANLARPLGLGSTHILDSLGFAFLLVSFGYAALEKTVSNERRLFSVESELAVAREIQMSILPAGVPEIDKLRISAAYHPMTEVAGDFYDFIVVDQKRAGILVADVSGHGVPSALIASMIKVAVQTVVPCASDPRAVLRGLNRILSGQLHGRFVTAAYLWLDTEDRAAQYSAAGHPALLRWRQGKLDSIESNGLLFGVTPNADYPVSTLPIHPGDRFLLYTDGVTEPENAHGDSFGDRELEQVIRRNQSCPASELSDQLLSAIRRWQPASIAQQDDITLVVVDVV
jgi:phosphoserine phosphatase RsbU/P